MQTTFQRANLDELKKSMEKQVKRLNDRIKEMERSLNAIRISRTVEQAKRAQGDTNWLKELQKQYDDKVCRSTLKVNRLFPVADE